MRADDRGPNPYPNLGNCDFCAAAIGFYGCPKHGTDCYNSDLHAKWFIGHRRPHVLGATSWYGAYHTEDEAKADMPAVREYWFRRAGINGPQGYTFIERDDDADDCDYGQLTVERHNC